MPVRSTNPTKHRDRRVEESTSLRALRRAAREGFAQIDRGEFAAVPAGELGDFVAAIGKRAARHTRSKK